MTKMKPQTRDMKMFCRGRTGAQDGAVVSSPPPLNVLIDPSVLPTNVSRDDSGLRLSVS